MSATGSSPRSPEPHAHCVLRPPFDTLWATNDAFAAARAVRGRLVRDLEGRQTLRFEVGGKGYYLKRHRGAGWSEIFNNLLRLRLPVLGAGSEWRAIEAFHHAGIPTMNAVAFGERGRGPAGRESFLITEAIEPAIDLDVHTRDWVHTPPAPAHKHALIHRVAGIARRMHDAGINHRDFYLCHFLLHLDADTNDTRATPRVSVIDLHRAQLRARTPERWRNKDLAALYFSALRIGLTSRDRLRFLRTYFDAPPRVVLARERTRLAWLEREAERLLRRYDRKFAHRPELQR